MASSQGKPKPSWRTHSLNPFKNKSQDQVQPNHAQESSQSLPINAVYYPNWRVYKGLPPSSLNLRYITHVFYAFAWVRNQGHLFFSDEYADTEIDTNGDGSVKGCLNDLRALKERYPNIKTILSVGGGGEGSAPFPAVASNGIVRSSLAQSARQMVDAFGFDGIDIDWEHPSDPKQGKHYVQLLAALRKELPAPKYLLTSALPAGEWALRNIDLGKASTHLDLINLMTYDFSGPWTNLCGHHAQLYSPKNPHNDAAKVSCSSAVAYAQSQGVPARRILLGVPAYGRSFLGANKVGDRFTGHGGEEGVFEYKDLPRPGANVKFDKEAGAVYCVGGDGGFVTYDDDRSVEMKAQFALKEGLRGLFFWTGTGDTESTSLVETSYRSLYPQHSNGK